MYNPRHMFHPVVSITGHVYDLKKKEKPYTMLNHVKKSYPFNFH